MKNTLCILLLCLFATYAYAGYIFSGHGEVTGEFRVINKVISDANGERVVQHNVVILDKPISVSCDANDGSCKESNGVTVVYLKNNEKVNSVFGNYVNSINYVSGIFRNGTLDGGQDVVYIEPEIIAGQSLAPPVKVEKPIKPENKAATSVKTTEPVQSDADKLGLSSRAKKFFAGVGDDFYTIIAIGLAVVGVFLLVAGAFRRVVIYYDTSDMAVSLVAGIFIIFLFGVYDLKEVHFFSSEFMNFMAKWTIVIGCYSCAIISTLITFNNAITHNRSIVLGLFIGLFKLLFIAITAIVMIAQVLRLLEHKSGREMLLASLLLAVFGSLVGIMINGQEVYEAKGWRVPEDSRA